MIATGGPGWFPGATGGGGGTGSNATGRCDTALGREAERIAATAGADRFAVLLALQAAIGAAVGPGPHVVVHDRRIPAIIWCGLVGHPDRARRVIDAVVTEVSAADPSLPVAEISTVDALVGLLITAGPDPRALVVVDDLAALLHAAAGDPTARAVLADAGEGGGRRRVGGLGAATPAAVRRLFATPPGADLGALVLWGAA